MAAYAAAQKSRASSVGTGEVIIRWVSRMPVRPDPVSVRHAVPEPPSQPNPPGITKWLWHPLRMSGKREALVFLFQCKSFLP